MTARGGPGYSRRAMQGLQHAGAFLVRFAEGTNFVTARVTGRVDHVASGRTTRFESVTELLAFIARVLAETTEPPSGLAAKTTWKEDV
jgi:hypothetical protein